MDASDYVVWADDADGFRHVVGRHATFAAATAAAESHRAPGLLWTHVSCPRADGFADWCWSSSAEARRNRDARRD